MKRYLGILAAFGVLSVLAVFAALPALSPASTNPGALKTTFKINVVFVGYQEQDIDLNKMKAGEPSVYNPLVRQPSHYGLHAPVGIEADYKFHYTFAPDTFNDSFFGYLASVGKPGAPTEYQIKYNNQVHNSLTVGPDVLYIDAPSTERWLMLHARSDLEVDVSTYTVFFVNWHGRKDFKFHVYTKTDSPDPDTRYNFGALDTRKMIAWGGSFGRTWFHDLSAGPESMTANYDVDDARPGYRIPPVWEYGNLTAYRPFDDLSGDLALVLRYVAVNLLFTASPIFDPLASMPPSGCGKTVRIHMFEDDPVSKGTEWIDQDYLKKTLQDIQPQYAWRFTLKDHQPLTGEALDSFLVWAGHKQADSCWNAYGDTFAELFCFFDIHRDDYLASPLQNYNIGVFAFNTTPERLIHRKNLAGYTEDDHASGYPTYTFALGTEDGRREGRGFSTNVAHELGLHMGLSNPSDGYDSSSGTEFQANGDTLFAMAGNESDTAMSSMHVSNSFGWFDRDNMNRCLTARAILRAGQISAEIQQLPKAVQAQTDIAGAEALLSEARKAFQKMDYDLAARQAQAGLYRLVDIARAAGLDVKIAPEPLDSTLSRTDASTGSVDEQLVNESEEAAPDKPQAVETLKAKLTLSVSPAKAGVTKPSGTSEVSIGRPISIEAKAALGWRFTKWTVVSGNVEIDNVESAGTVVLLRGNSELVANFAPGSTFTLSTAVYPEGAGSVTPSGASQWNLGDVIAVSAKEASKDFIFYKWECSEGCEIMDAFKDKSAIKLSKDAKLGSIVLTANFLSVDTAAGSAKFEASYAETLGETKIVPVNLASVSMNMKNALAGMVVDKDTSVTAMFSNGMAMTSHSVSDDPKSVVGKSSGSAKFMDRAVGSGKATAVTQMSWKNGSLSIGYDIKQGAEFNVVDLYSNVYKKGGGRWIPIKDSDTALGGIPAVLALEGTDWAMICISPKGLDFTGRGKSTPSQQIHDDLVSWSVKGSGSFRVYKWISPHKQTAGMPSIHAPAAVLAAHAGESTQRAASGRITTAAPDPGMVTNFNITSPMPTSMGPPTETHAPFFFGGKIYSISRPDNYDGAVINAGALNSDGKYENKTSFLSLLGDTTYSFKWSNDWTTCVFNGQVFLFYTTRSEIKPYERFNIYATSTSAPETGWSNLGFVKYADELVYGLRSDNPNRKFGDATPLKAVAFNGRIYLIFTAANGAFTFISSKDGKKWDYGGSINDAWSWGDKFKPQFNACVVTKNGIPTLCVAIAGTEKYSNFCYLRFIDSNDKLVGGYHQLMDWASSDRGIGISTGSVKNSQQGSVVQIFAENSAWEILCWPPRRMALDVDTQSVQGWMDMPKSGSASQKGPPDAVEVSMPVAGKTTDLRKYIVFFNTSYSSYFAEYVDVVSYESDYFSADPNEKWVNTADPQYADDRAWWLVGVVDGVPPFTRNGSSVTSSLSEVEYSIEASQTKGADMKIEGEVYVETGFKTKVVDVGIQGGISVKNIFSVASGYERTVKISLTHTWQGTESNINGKYGFLLYAKPTITSRKYDWLSQDKKVKIGSYALLNISTVGIYPADFELASPPEGLTKRKPTNDLNYWKNERGDFPPFDSEYFYKYVGSPMVVTDHSPSSISAEKEVVKDKKISNETTVEISGKVKAGLALSGSSSLTAEFCTSIKEAYSEAIKAKLSKIPVPTGVVSGNIKQLIVDWAWYVPKDEALLKDMEDKIPEWIPNSARHQSQPPWYLTWKVVDFVEHP